MFSNSSDSPKKTVDGAGESTKEERDSRRARREVLVHSENQDVLNLIQSILSQAGYSVTCISTASAVVAAATGANFDAVLLNDAADESQLILCRELSEVLPFLPIVFFSTRHRAQRSGEARSAGALAYLNSSVEILGLPRALEKLLAESGGPPARGSRMRPFEA